MIARICVAMVLLCASTVSAQNRPSRRESVLPPAPPPPVAAPVPCPPGAPPPAASGEPARLQLDAFELVTTSEKLHGLELDDIGSAPSGAVLEKLSELGAARLLVRIDNTLDLSSECTLTSGKRVPTVQDVNVNANGKVTPSVSYQSIGTSLNCRGHWRGGDERDRMDFSLTFEVSSIVKAGIEVSGGVKLPIFNTVKFRQQLALESGRPVLFLSNDVPAPGDEGGQTTVTIVRLTCTRLAVTSRPASETRATTTQPMRADADGPPALIRVELIELTAQSEKLSWTDVQTLLPPGTSLDEGMKSLRKVGKAEVLSRPPCSSSGPRRRRSGWGNVSRSFRT